MTAPVPLRERNRLRTRTDILDAAADLLDETDTFDESVLFTLESLGQRAGLSRGTVYAHFPGGRDEVIAGVYQRLSEQVLQRGLDLRDGARTTTERIHVMAQALLEMTARPGGRFYCSAGPEIATHLVGASGRASTVFEGLLRDDLDDARGQLPPGTDTAALATVLSGAIRGAGVAAARGTVPPEALLQAVTALATGLLGETSGR
ncbi:TetR/AcrR family transcriptional regulator [Kineococcus arenarius]|uniref:TetR/AcrR family transcriptional regulator n=1 Tax=unclassified Kineococcus TaxID=2621656 RepID=UPI003D7CE042